MDTSWTASVPLLAIADPASAPAKHVRKVSLSTIFSLSLLFKRGSKEPKASNDKPAPVSLPSTLLLEGVGLLSGIEVPDDTDDEPAPVYTLERALCNLKKFHTGLTAAIGSRAQPETDADLVVTTCKLTKALVNGAIACAVFLRGEADATNANTIDAGALSTLQVAQCLHTCLEAAFILYNIIANTDADKFEPADAIKDVAPISSRVAAECDAAIKYVNEVVLASFFELDHSLRPLITYAIALAKTQMNDDNIALAAQLAHTLKHFGDWLATVPYLHRVDGSEDKQIPVRLALELHVYASELAVALMVKETRDGAQQTAWIEGTQRFVLKAIEGTAEFVQLGGANLVLEPLDQYDWFPEPADDNGECDVSLQTESSADDDSDYNEFDDPDVDMVAESGPTASLLAFVNSVTDRFVEADEGLLRQFPDRIVSDGERLETGRHRASRKFKDLLRQVLTAVNETKIRDAKQEIVDNLTEMRRAEREARDAQRCEMTSEPAAKSQSKSKPKGKGKSNTKATDKPADKPNRGRKRKSGDDVDLDEREAAEAEGTSAELSSSELDMDFDEPILEPELAASKIRRFALDTEKALKQHGVSQRTLDDILRPAKKPRLSGESARGMSGSRGPSGSRAPSGSRPPSRRVSGTSFIENELRMSSSSPRVTTAPLHRQSNELRRTASRG